MKIERGVHTPTITRPSRPPTPVVAGAIDSVTLSAPAPGWSNQTRPASLVARQSDGRIVLDGVRWGYHEAPDRNDWQPVFLTTTVDPSKVKDVYLTIEPFKPEAIAAHVRLVFAMEEDGKVTAGPMQDGGFYVSFEARMHVGETYNPLTGMGRHYRPIVQLGTFTDALQRKTRKLGNSVIRYKLALTPAQKQQLLRNGIDFALLDHSSEWYNTANNSCYDQSLKLINTVLPEDRKIPAWRMDGHYNPFVLDPCEAGSVLMNFNLLASVEGIRTEPDLGMWPNMQHVPGTFGKIGGAIGRVPGLRTALRVGGLIGGAAAAGAMVSGPPAVVVGAAFAGGAFGHWLGRGVANHLILLGHLHRERSEDHFPNGSPFPPVS